MVTRKIKIVQTCPEIILQKRKKIFRNSPEREILLTKQKKKKNLLNKRLKSPKIKNVLKKDSPNETNSP